MEHRHELVKFEGPQGTLSGVLHIPDGNPDTAVLLSHCFTCSKSLKTTKNFASGIEEGGYAVLRYDFTGLGESEGDFGDTSVTTNVEDIEAAAGYLVKRGYEKIVMAGHSLGGAATLIAASRIDQTVAVAAIAAPSGPEHVKHLFSEEVIEKAFEHGRAEVSIAGRKFSISQDFFEDLSRHCTPEKIAEIDTPLLVVHGTADTIVEITEGEKTFEAATQPKSFAAIPGADHLFVKPGTVEHVTDAIRTFLRVNT